MMIMRLGRFVGIALLVFVMVNISFVSADELDSADDISNDTTDFEVNPDYPKSNDTMDNVFRQDNLSIEKSAPEITFESTKLKSRDTVSIHLKNSTGEPLKSRNLTALLDNEKYSLSTNSKGIASFEINLDAGTYLLNVSFDGDENYGPVSKAARVKVSKLSTKISPASNFVIRGHYLSFYLYDQRNDEVSSKKVTFTLNGRSYARTTDSKGRVKLKIDLYGSKYPMKFKFRGDRQYKSSSKKINLLMVTSKSLTIGNSKLLSKGYLRIYLKDSTKSAVSKKNIKIKIGKKAFNKKTTSEGIAVIKPKAGTGTYIIKASCGKYWVSKKVRCVDQSVRDPLEENISLKNGIPDIDVMPGNYVWGDESATYTLTKAQYREVIQRDSHCLFLNKKLSRYTFFKTKSHPNTNHIVKREKWNVIERAVNVKIVQANRHNYWPGEITVSLKGKSYTYPEVRDVQSNALNCGPTSASVCTQVLRNYYCESYLAKQMGTNAEGTPCPKIIKGLEKNGFSCTYFYKATFGDALKELGKGGCALIFHAPYHYVAVLDISRDGKMVLVSNSYGTYDNIPSKWVKVNTLKNKFSKWEESLIVKLNYKLSNSTINSVNAFYNSMGTSWNRQNTNQIMGLI